MTQKLRPPQGWAYPLAPVNVHQFLPGVGHIGWNGAAGNTQGSYLVFSAGWYPGSTMREPTFGISAVLVEDLDLVKEWFEKSVRPEALDWLKNVKHRAPSKRGVVVGSQHHRHCPIGA